MWGTTGVTMFFTLSGFLITALLLEEHARAGRVRLGGFYQRRAVRLLPAVVVLLTASVVIGFASPAAALAAAGYMSNWMLASGAVDMGWIGHTWSLSIEEQFYLLWPLVVIALSRTRNPRRWMLAACGVGVVGAWIVRGVLWDGGAGHMRIYAGLDTRADALLVGCGLAVLMPGRQVGRSRTRLLDVGVVAVAAGAYLLKNPAGDYLLLPMWLPLATAGLLYLIATDARTQLLTAPALRWVGRRSYALYLWHVPVIYYAHEIDLPGAKVAAILVSLAAAETSWRLIEAPAQRWFRRRSVRAVEAPRLLRGRRREDPTRAEATPV